MLTSPIASPPLVAILRGLEPGHAAETCRVLVAAGFRALEVPMNSPRATDSIALLSKELGGGATIGAGTVTTPAEVEAVARAGGRFIVMPHADVAIIRAAKTAGLLCLPGVATPTEAFAALAAGADALKLFPAETLGPATLKAWRAVLPRDVQILPVGGITPDHMPAWVAAGANGFGIGSALYVPGRSIEDTARRASTFVHAAAALFPSSQESRA
ncbi:MAG TPA: 2-dehydro-3-deoxy-6-phosphogalactonate aldolase [Rhodanobacteraceae bacterium]|nr:2-dehydro-3-deoxy-6-phosphogalactonate aldolase [Rhodanobacteraceae bacterium]